MSQYEHRTGDQFEILIRRALLESVADEEPPARVWERIRARLTQPDRRLSVQWSGPVLQAAMLILLLMLGSLSVWQKWSGERSGVVPSQASPTASMTPYGTDHSPASSRTSHIWTPAQHGGDSSESYAKGNEAAMDEAKIALLREHPASRPETVKTRGTPATGTGCCHAG